MPRKRKHGVKQESHPASASGAMSASSNFSLPRAFEQRVPPLIKPSLMNLFGSSLRPAASTSTSADESPPQCYRDECATSIVFAPYRRPKIFKRCPVLPPPSYRPKTTKVRTFCTIAVLPPLQEAEGCLALPSSLHYTARAFLKNQ